MQIKHSALRFVCFICAAPVISQVGSGPWTTITLENLCITEGAIEKTSGGAGRVSVPKMRAYVAEETAPAAELRFTYLGPTSNDSALGSGIMRRQLGLKLRAQDACNLIYVMWRIEPEPKLVVSVKQNAGEHTSAECGNRGYRNIKPVKAVAAPRLEAGQSHTLRAEMNRDELRVFADNREVWEGSVGSDAAQLKGPIGIRSDNAQVEFTLKVQMPDRGNGTASGCKSGADSD
jgi:hypothetical protein